jgi:hypothetical protein
MRLSSSISDTNVSWLSIIQCSVFKFVHASQGYRWKIHHQSPMKRVNLNFSTACRMDLSCAYLAYCTLCMIGCRWCLISSLYYLYQHCTCTASMGRRGRAYLRCVGEVKPHKKSIQLQSRTQHTLVVYNEGYVGLAQVYCSLWYAHFRHCTHHPLPLQPTWEEITILPLLLILLTLFLLLHMQIVDKDVNSYKLLLIILVDSSYIFCWMYIVMYVATVVVGSKNKLRRL